MEIKDFKEVERWLGSITNHGTRAIYLSAIRQYVAFTKKDPDKLIDEAIEDMRKDPREKTDIVKRTLISFREYLLKEVPKKKPMGNKKVIIVGKGLSPKMTDLYVTAIRSFYGTFDIRLKLRFLRPKVLHPRRFLTNIDTKKLADYCSCIRDRAIVLTMFQSGMDESTLCDLKYGNIKEGLEKEEYPLILRLQRIKTGVEYITFLGRDAIDALKAYIAVIKKRKIVFNEDTPLFVKDANRSNGIGMTTDLIEVIMKKLADKAGFGNGVGYNRCGSHALRESFSKILTNHGVPNSTVDFLLGHSVGDLANAYMSVGLDDLRRIYLENEKYLSIYQTASTTSDNRIEKLESEIAFLKENLFKLDGIKPEYLTEAIQSAYEKTLRDGMKIEQES